MFLCKYFAEMMNPTVAAVVVIEMILIAAAEAAVDIETTIVEVAEAGIKMTLTPLVTTIDEKNVVEIGSLIVSGMYGTFGEVGVLITFGFDNVVIIYIHFLLLGPYENCTALNLISILAHAVVAGMMMTAMVRLHATLNGATATTTTTHHAAAAAVEQQGQGAVHVTNLTATIPIETEIGRVPLSFASLWTIA